MCRGHRGIARRAAAFADLLLLRIRCCGFAFRPRSERGGRCPQPSRSRVASRGPGGAPPVGTRWPRRAEPRQVPGRARAPPAPPPGAERAAVHGACLHCTSGCVHMAGMFVYTHTCLYKYKYICLCSRSLPSLVPAFVSTGDARREPGSGEPGSGEPGAFCRPSASARGDRSPQGAEGARGTVAHPSPLPAGARLGGRPQPRGSISCAPA